jgi:hypothetical protein
MTLVTPRAMRIPEMTTAATMQATTAAGMKASSGLRH